MGMRNTGWKPALHRTRRHDDEANRQVIARWQRLVAAADAGLLSSEASRYVAAAGYPPEVEK